MIQRDPQSGEHGSSVDEREERLARARLAFDRGLHEASETGARAARRLLVPALWGAALVGGALLTIAMIRLIRRPTVTPALFRITIEPRLQARPLIPALGGVVARLAMQRLLAAVSSDDSPGGPVEGSLSAAAHGPGAMAHQNGSSSGSSHDGHAKA